MKVSINKGFVELVASEAKDLSVVNSARVSFGKKKNFMEPEDEKLISFLMKNRHGTPFEHNFFQFHVKCPIFVMREWIRHRISSFNELSMRYTQPELEFFIPNSEDMRTQVGKPGNYHYEQFPDLGKADLWLRMVQDHCEHAQKLYELAIDWGIAKEQARIVLPVNVYTEFYWSINARSLMNFLSLRSAESAMKEIRDFSLAIETMFESQMPITYKAFLDNGRVAP